MKIQTKFLLSTSLMLVMSACAPKPQATQVVQPPKIVEWQKPHATKAQADKDEHDCLYQADMATAGVMYLDMKTVMLIHFSHECMNNRGYTEVVISGR